MSESTGLKILLAIAVSFLALHSSYAQPKSLGASFSFSGFGVTYENELNHDSSFIELSLRAETAEFFIRKSKECPGISGSFTWNLIIREWLSSEGNVIRLFAGPGAIIGYGPDFKSDDGVIIGMKGRIGTECSFARNASISICLTPVIGSHITADNGAIVMKYYRNGVQYALVPEIGIKYRF